MTLITRTVESEYYALVYWSDGMRIAGLLGRPMAPGPHPAIIYNRGGNGPVGALNGAEIVPFVEAGYVAVASQYRGTAGSEGREEFGGADVHDVLNLVPLLKARPEVDPERIGMMGHSRGGMMTYLALKEDALAGTHDIKAAATVGGVSDLLYMHEMDPDLVDTTWAPLIGALPEEAPELYTERSAVCWPALIDAPLLIQQGARDRQVPPLQAYRLARALRNAGKTVKMNAYYDDDHSLSKHYLGYPAALGWFQKYLSVPGEDLSFRSHKAAILNTATWFANTRGS